MMCTISEQCYVPFTLVCVYLCFATHFPSHFFVSQLDAAVMIVCLLHLLVFLLSPLLNLLIMLVFLSVGVFGHSVQLGMRQNSLQILLLDMVNFGLLKCLLPLSARCKTPSQHHPLCTALSCMNSLSLTEQKFEVFILTNWFMLVVFADGIAMRMDGH